MRHQVHRQSHGYSLAESIIFIAPVLVVTTGAVALLFYMGTRSYCQQKLNFICNQAAVYTCSRAIDRSNSTSSYVKLLGQRLNLPIKPEDVTVTKEQFQVSKGTVLPGYTVTISAQVPLLVNGFGNIGTINDSATASVPLSEFSDYNAVLVLETPHGSDKDLLVPAFYVPAPHGSNPYRYLPRTTSRALMLTGIWDRGDPLVGLSGIAMDTIEPSVINGNNQ